MQTEPTDKKLSFSYSVTIRGRQDIDIYPQVSGTTEKLRVIEGQKVCRGQPLFTTDQVPHRAALKTAITNAEVARAATSTTELAYKNNKELYAQKVISESSLKTTKNSHPIAKAQLAQVEAQGTNACSNLSYTGAKNPSNGVIGALPYRADALINVNIPYPLIMVSDNSDIYVHFLMTENQLLALTRQYGNMDGVLENVLGVELVLNDGSVHQKKGTIEPISRVIDRQTGIVVVRVMFPNEPRLPHSRAPGTAIVSSIYKNCIAIPQTATVRMQDKMIACEVVDGKAVSTLIIVAGINDRREHVVLDGLKIGDGTVLESVGLVREGTQVK